LRLVFAIHSIATIRNATAGQTGRDGFTTQIEPEELAPFISALKAGMTLNLKAATGAPKADISLRGAVASLLNIDAIQGRVGTKTALISKGDKASGTAGPTDLPTIVAAKLSPSAAPDKTIATSLRQHLKTYLAKECDDGVSDRGFEDEVESLDREHALVGLICSTGAYNITTDFWIVTGSNVGAAIAVAFDAPNQKPSNRLVRFRSADGSNQFFPQGSWTGGLRRDGQICVDGRDIRASVLRSIASLSGSHLRGLAGAMASKTTIDC
jgi:hypothetical protein